MRPSSSLSHCCLLAPAVASYVNSGCATLFNGTRDDVHVDSTPVGAHFSVVSAGGGITAMKDVEVASGSTPAVVSLLAESSYVLLIKFDGCREVKVPLERDFNGSFVCSVLCGLLPSGVDVLTGGMWDLTPEQINVPLQQVVPAAPKATPSEPSEPVPVESDIGGGERRIYLVVVRKGEDGQLRRLAVPLERESI